MRHEGPATEATVSKARAHQPGGTGVSFHGGGWCVPKGLRGWLQLSRPGYTSLGGHGVWPRRWSVRHEGPTRGAAVSKGQTQQPGDTGGLAQAVVGASRRARDAVSKARAHPPRGIGGPAVAVVGASRRACKGDCSHQAPGTPAGGEKGSCPGGGRCVMKGPRRELQSPRPGLTSLRGPGCPVLAVVGASRRAREGGCSYPGPGTAAGGDMGSCPGGGRCVMKGPLRGLQCPRPGHTSLRGQGIVPKRWSLRPEGPARGAAVSKAPANQPGGTGGPTLVVVGAS